MKRYRCTNYKRFITFMTIVLVAASVLGQVIMAKATEAADPVEVMAVLIREGDSLWEIADRYDDNSMDLRKYIEIIRAYNRMDDALLQPGDTIYVPLVND